MPQVGIIDYGVGNLRSVEKAFAAGGCDAVVSADENVLRRAERLVLPGVAALINLCASVWPRELLC